MYGIETQADLIFNTVFGIAATLGFLGFMRVADGGNKIRPPETKEKTTSKRRLHLLSFFKNLH